MKHSILFCLLVWLISCNDKERQLNSHKNNDNPLGFYYNLTYDEATDSTFVLANFNGEEQNRQQTPSSGTGCYALLSVQLEAGSSISFNDSLLKEIKRNTSYMYSGKYKGHFSSGKFILKDKNGKELINEIPFPEKIGFPAMSTFNKNFELSFKWTNGPMNEIGNYGRFYIVDSKGKEQASSIPMGDPEKLTCPVNQTYADGAATFHITREKRLNVEQNGKKGQIYLKYIAKPLPITIVSSPEQPNPPVVSIGKNPF